MPGVADGISINSLSAEKILGRKSAQGRSRSDSGSSVESGVSAGSRDRYSPRADKTPSPTWSESGVMQHAEDLTYVEPTGPVSKLMLRTVGTNFTRRVSNLFKYVGIGGFLKPARGYVNLGPEVFVRQSDNTRLQINGRDINMAQLAERFKPNIFTINSERIKDKDLMPIDMRWEVLPPKNTDCLSIVYYVKTADENMPIPIIGTLYDWIRPVLWGSKADWEAVVVDVNRNTGEPEKLVYETCNLTADPNSYYAKSKSDLHLKCEVKKEKDGWKHSFERNGKLESKEIVNPFELKTNFDLAYVSWNGGFELNSVCEGLGYGKGKKLLQKVCDAPLNFLGMDTYQDQGFDLRAGWLTDRKNRPVEIGLRRSGKKEI